MCGAWLRRRLKRPPGLVEALGGPRFCGVGRLAHQAADCSAAVTISYSIGLPTRGSSGDDGGCGRPRCTRRPRSRARRASFSAGCSAARPASATRTLRSTCCRSSHPERVQGGARKLPINQIARRRHCALPRPGAASPANRQARVERAAGRRRPCGRPGAWCAASMGSGWTRPRTIVGAAP